MKSRKVKRNPAKKSALETMKRRKKFRKRNLPVKKNPSEGGIMHIVKQVTPAASAFIATTTATGRVESLVAGLGLFGMPGPATTVKQKLVAVGTPLLMLLAAHLVTKKVLQNQRVGILAGVGVAAAYKLIAVLFTTLRPKLGLSGTPVGESAYTEDAFYGPPAKKGVASVESDDDFTDMQTGIFGDN